MHSHLMWRAVAMTVATALVIAGGVWLAPVLAQTPVRPTTFKMQALMGGGSEIGVTVRDVNDAETQREKLAGQAGAYVEEVRSGGPAAEAGFKTGDVIVAFDGERVRSARQLDRLVEETPAGRVVEATVSRSGQRVTLKVTPEAPAGPAAFLGGGMHSLAPNVDWPTLGSEYWQFGGFGANTGRLGVSVLPLGDQLGEYFGTKTGVLVTSVTAGTPAATAGLKAGDVITKVNGTTIDNVNDLRRSIGDTSGDVALTIVRNHKEQTLKATFGDTRPRVRTTI